MVITLTKKTKKTYNEKCGDCYYNGDCNISTRTCPYLKTKVIQN